MACNHIIHHTPSFLLPALYLYDKYIITLVTVGRFHFHIWAPVQEIHGRGEITTRCLAVMVYNSRRFELLEKSPCTWYFCVHVHTKKVVSRVKEGRAPSRVSMSHVSYIRVWILYMSHVLYARVMSPIHLCLARARMPVGQGGMGPSHTLYTTHP